MSTMMKFSNKVYCIYVIVLVTVTIQISLGREGVEEIGRNESAKPCIHEGELCRTYFYASPCCGEFCRCTKRSYMRYYCLCIGDKQTGLQRNSSMSINTHLLHNSTRLSFNPTALIRMVSDVFFFFFFN